MISWAVELDAGHSIRQIIDYVLLQSNRAVKVCLAAECLEGAAGARQGGTECQRLSARPGYVTVAGAPPASEEGPSGIGSLALLTHLRERQYRSGRR